MSWDEFTDLLAGLGPDTALGRIISIRSETDAERIKQFSPDQQRIRQEWFARQVGKKSQEELDDCFEGLKNAFLEMAGGFSTSKDE